MSRPALDVQLSFGWRIGCGLTLMSVFAVPFFASAVYGLTAGSTSRQITMAFAMSLGSVLVFGLVPMLLLVRKRGSVGRFDGQGVTRGDGRLFPWSQLSSVQRTFQSRHGHRFLLSVELKFTSGSATVWAATVKNFAEVSPVLDALEAGKNPWS